MIGSQVFETLCEWRVVEARSGASPRRAPYASSVLRVSWLCEIGRMPARLISPTVGFTVTVAVTPDMLVQGNSMLGRSTQRPIRWLRSWAHSALDHINVHFAHSVESKSSSLASSIAASVRKPVSS